MTRHTPSSPAESETFGQNVSIRLEQPVGAASISPSGRDVVLASKEGLHVIDLDSPYSPPRYLPHRTPWEVADVQWSPHAAKDYWVASTSNQKALVWNLAIKDWQGSIEHVLHAHSRAITDINWSAHNPWVLATCAVDSFVHCWDLRNPYRPATSFSDWFAGATQVKWSRQDEHVLASSHDRFLHVWDDRYGASPVKTVEAHVTKIYGIDWNRFEPSKLITCSLDKTVKLWNFNLDTDGPERVIETPFPVWRARYTPFGWGVVAMPQRGNSDLHLYDRQDHSFKNGKNLPVATFPGHDGLAKEFLWRARGPVVDSIDHRDFQLVTWGSDKVLRLHKVDQEVLESVGYVKGRNSIQKLNFTRKGAVYRTFTIDPEDADQTSDTLSRVDTLSTQHQSMLSRQRTSTSARMSKHPVFQFRGWIAGAKTKTRTGMHGKGAARQNMNPIAWLKNVKIALQDPDTLADEILQVSEKFKRVEFEQVDIPHRKAVACLQAPWGEGQSNVYVRVELRFPKLYPRNSGAVILLQRNSAISEEVHKTMVTELQTISETYATRKRGCIEGLVRYLLLEQTLEQIVGWLLGESLLDSRLIGPDDVLADESSDDEDQERPEPLASQFDTTANVRLPIAKGCGALWSETGILVCFFEPKHNEPKSTLTLLGSAVSNDSQSRKLYEGFGRLGTASPPRKATTGTGTVEDDTDADNLSSDASSSTSSSTDGSARLRDGLWPFRGALAGLHLRPRSTERSNRSTILGRLRQEETAPLNFVSLHDFTDLLPCRKDLAQEYSIFGQGHELCIHNMKVAQEAGLHDLAATWTLTGMILRDDVPLKLIRRSKRKGDEAVLVLAHWANLQLNGRQQPSKIHKRSKIAQSPSQTANVRWGNNPLATGYLLPALFHHFEKLADVQTLAMLSCVFATSTGLSSRGDERSSKHGFQAESHLKNTPQYFPSLRIAQSIDVDETIKDGFVFVQPFLDDTSASAHTGHENRHDVRRRATVLPSVSNLADHGTRVSTRRSSRAASVSAEESNENASVHLHSTSLSTSPETARTGHKHNSGIVLPSAKASLSALTSAYSNSPPSNIHAGPATTTLKKYSPSGSLTPGQWVANSLFGSTSNRTTRSSSQQVDPRSIQSHGGNLRSRASLTSLRSYQKDANTTPDVSQKTTRNNSVVDMANKSLYDPSALQPRKFKTSLHNQEFFDLEGYSPKPLLDPKLQLKFKMYRANYVKLLDVWNLPKQRAEMAKFDSWLNGMAEPEVVHASISRRPSISASKITQRPRRMTLVDNNHTASTLQIRTCCQKCGESLSAVEKNGVAIGWYCTNTACLTKSYKATKRNRCDLCQKVLSGLSMPCLECGHITCYECYEAWFGQPSLSSKGSSQTTKMGKTQGGDAKRADIDKQMAVGSCVVDDSHDRPSCPTGCGCSCQTLTEITVPRPPIKDEPAPIVNEAIPRRKSDASYLERPLKLNRGSLHEQQYQQHSAHNTISATPSAYPAPATGAIAALNRVRSKSLAKDTANTRVVRSSIKRSGSSFATTRATGSTLSSMAEATIDSDEDDEESSAAKQQQQSTRKPQQSDMKPKPPSITTTTHNPTTKGYPNPSNGRSTRIVPHAQHQQQQTGGSDSDSSVHMTSTSNPPDTDFDEDPYTDLKDHFTATTSASASSNTQVANKNNNDNDDEETDPLNPWASSKIASLGRGIGAGLSRGLKPKGSDATIRRVPTAASATSKKQ